MAREFTRSDRVAAQIQRELADLLRTEVREPAIGMATINGVEVTRDMAVAKAYVSFLGASEPPKKCVAILMQSVPMLRHQLGKRMRLRVMPELRFVYDESIERAMRMDALLSGLEHPDSKPPDADP
jgi:ribosome-binding factor A